MSGFPDVFLERYLTGDLTPAECARLEAALKTDASLTARLALLEESSSQFFEAVDPKVFSRRLEGRLEMESRTETPRWMGLARWSGAFGTLCIVFGVYWFASDLEQVNDQALMVTPVAVKGAAEVQVAQNTPKAAPPAPQAKAAGSEPEPALTGGDPQPRREHTTVLKNEVAHRAAAPQVVRTQNSSKALRQPASRPVRRKRGEDKRATAPEMGKAFVPVAPQEREERPEVARKESLMATSEDSEEAAPRLMMMRSGLASSPKLVVRTASGERRDLMSHERIRAGETIEMFSLSRSPMFWTYAVTRQNDPTPVKKLSKPLAWKAGATLNISPSLTGPVTLWVAVCPASFSTEKILFDGFSFRSENQSCQVFSFFAIF